MSQSPPPQSSLGPQEAGDRSNPQASGASSKLEKIVFLGEDFQVSDTTEAADYSHTDDGHKKITLDQGKTARIYARRPAFDLKSMFNVEWKLITTELYDWGPGIRVEVCYKIGAGKDNFDINRTELTTKKDISKTGFKIIADTRVWVSIEITNGDEKKGSIILKSVSLEGEHDKKRTPE